ncbi:anti-sigma factor antagonist [Actinoalloteichus sp. AHMU CJ021]|uniref:STAS domain-containing protein n=1 Tax=Actinoalloteichus sp. AHMU CJ021 TaxID=2072503 RepID=UPI000CA08EC9|nr:anti-sigma factor antagonist [Actinoalloteichus sp. AHMU CJ021]
MTGHPAERKPPDESGQHDCDVLAETEIARGTLDSENVGFIRLSGEVDHYSAPQLDTVVDQLLASGATGFTLDFAEVTFLDSACLSSLVRARRLVQPRGGEVVLAAMNRHASRVMRITGLHTIFRFVDGARQ